MIQHNSVCISVEVLPAFPTQPTEAVSDFDEKADADIDCLC
jgi:hypothetical protein